MRLAAEQAVVEVMSVVETVAAELEAWTM